MATKANEIGALDVIRTGPGGHLVLVEKLVGRVPAFVRP